MRIVFLSSRFLPEYSGGAELYTYHLAKQLRRLGHEVSVLYAPQWQTDEDAGAAYRVECEDDTFDTIPVRKLHFDWRRAPDPHGFIYDHNPEIERHITDYLQKQRAEIVHITSNIHLTSSTITAAKGLRLPVVWTLTQYWMICPRTTLQRGDGGFCPGRQSGLDCLFCLYGATRTYRALAKVPSFARRALLRTVDAWASLFTWNSSMNLIGAVERRNRRLRTLVPEVDCIVAPSRFIADTIAATGIVNRDRIVISPHGQDVARAVHGTQKTPSSVLRFGYTGHIVPHKGVHLLIDAFKQLGPAVEAELHIYGDLAHDPSYAQSLISAASGCPNIYFEGAFSNVDIGHVLKGIDVVAVPSTQYENAPLTIAEAYAAKTPVIAANIGGMAEAVQDGVTGLVFEVGNSVALACKLRLFVEQPALLAEHRGNIKPVTTIGEEARRLGSIYSRLRETMMQTQL